MLPGIISCKSNNILGEELIWMITDDEILSQRMLYDEYEMVSQNREREGLPEITLKRYMQDNGLNDFSQDLLKHPEDVPLILKIKLK